MLNISIKIITFFFWGKDCEESIQPPISMFSFAANSSLSALTHMPHVFEMRSTRHAYY